MFWYLIDRFDFVISLAMLLLPAAGIAYGLRQHRRHGEQNDVSSASGNAGIGCLAGGTLWFILFFFATCVAPGGYGDRASEGRARAYVIMSALGRYQVSHSTLPDSLNTLTPEYLTAAALLGPASGRSKGHPFRYKRTDSTYVLSFEYTNPGINSCEITSLDRRWRCIRYF